MATSRKSTQFLIPIRQTYETYTFYGANEFLLALRP